LQFQVFKCFDSSKYFFGAGVPFAPKRFSRRGCRCAGSHMNFSVGAGVSETTCTRCSRIRTKFAKCFSHHRVEGACSGDYRFFRCIPSGACLRMTDLFTGSCLQTAAGTFCPQGITNEDPATDAIAPCGGTGINKPFRRRWRTSSTASNDSIFSRR